MIVTVLDLIKERLGLTDEDMKLGKIGIVLLAIKEKYDDRKKKKERGEDVEFDFDF